METNLSTLLQEAPAQLEAFATGADSAAGRAGEFVKEAATLPQRLRQAITTKFEDNKDLIQNKNQALTDYLAAPSAARERYQDVFNPFAREALVEQDKAQKLGSLQTFTDLLTQRGQGVENIVGNTANAFAGEVGAAEIAANAAQSRFGNALAVANLKTGLVNNIESNKQREWDKLFSTLQITGGDIDVGGKNYHIPGYEEQLRIKEAISGGGKTATQAAEDARKTVQAISQSGGTLDSAMSAGVTMGLGAEDVLNIYNSSSIYGPAIETDQELEKRYGIARGELGAGAKNSGSTNAAEEFVRLYLQAQGQGG